MIFQSTESGAREQFPLLDFRAEAGVKGMLLVQRHQCHTDVFLCNVPETSIEYGQILNE